LRAAKLKKQQEKITNHGEGTEEVVFFQSFARHRESGAEEKKNEEKKGDRVEGGGRGLKGEKVRWCINVWVTGLRLQTAE